MAKTTTVKTLSDGSINFLDRASVLAALYPAPKKMQRTSLDLAHLARAKWIGLAKDNLHRSLRDYQNSIHVVKKEPEFSGASVDLVGKFPEIIEWGNKSPIDMRDWLLKYTREGGEIKQGENGRYRVIPMRRSLQGTGMAVPLAGQPYKSKIGERAAKALHSAIIAESRRKKIGTQFKDEDGRYHTTEGSGSISRKSGGPLYEAHHKSGLYAGLTRFTGKGGKDGQYKLFRVISENIGRGTTWMYPPTKGKHFLDEVQEYIAKEAPKVLANLWDE